MNEKTGWTQLAVPYFGEVVRRVCDDWFLKRGAGIIREAATGPIWYESGAGVIVEFTYYLEDAPRYAPTINVGIMRNQIFTGVGLWALIAPGTPDAEYYRWTFSDPVQLQSGVQRIRDTILPVYLDPLLSDPAAVVAAAELRRSGG